MQTKTFAALAAALGALTLSAGAAHAGGYWDGGNRAIYGGGWCPPPPPPPCDCPPRRGYSAPQAYDEGPPPGYGYDEAPPTAYGEDEGFAPSELFDEADEGGVGGPASFGAEDFGGGFVGGPVVGVDVGFGFRDHGRRFFDERQRFFGRQRFNERQRFDEHQRSQQHVFVRQHVQQHISVQQHIMQPHHATGGHGRW